MNITIWDLVDLAKAGAKNKIVRIILTGFAFILAYSVVSTAAKVSQLNIVKLYSNGKSVGSYHVEEIFHTEDGTGVYFYTSRGQRIEWNGDYQYTVKSCSDEQPVTQETDTLLQTDS